MAKISNCYGLYIYITPKKADALVESVRNCEATYKAEVGINIFNQTKDFTFKQFCKKLGIKYLVSKPTQSGEGERNVS